MAKINLIANFNEGRKPLRNAEARAGAVTEEVRVVARQYGKEYFDGDRLFGYGGYHYHPRFWTGVAEDLKSHYGLAQSSTVLEVGCAKGFLLYDLTRVVPGIEVAGRDISWYAINHEEVKPEVRPFIDVGNARNLKEFTDKKFDLVVSINTLHDLKLEDCKRALQEIQRVGKKAFVTMDAWRNDEEKALMQQWAINAQTVMHAREWKKLFDEVGYTGDYYWFVP